MILKYVKAFDKVKRSDIDKLLLDKLSDTLNEEQKKRKIKYFLKTLKDDQKIETMREGKNSYWKLIKGK